MKKELIEKLEISEDQAEKLTVGDLFDGGKYKGPEAAREKVWNYMEWRLRVGESNGADELFFVRRARQGIGENYYDVEQVRTFFKKMKELRGIRAQPRDLFLFQLAYKTGMRVSEIQRLNVRDVAEEISGDPRDKIIVIGKRNKKRTIPITVNMKKNIKKYLRWKNEHREDLGPEAPLFVSKFGRRLSVRMIQAAFEKWQERTGMERITFHGLRHSCGTHLVQRNPTGEGLLSAKKRLGHRSIITTDKYLHLGDDRQREAAERGLVEV